MISNNKKSLVILLIIGTLLCLTLMNRNSCRIVTKESKLHERNISLSEINSTSNKESDRHKRNLNTPKPNNFDTNTNVVVPTTLKTDEEMLLLKELKEKANNETQKVNSEVRTNIASLSRGKIITSVNESIKLSQKERDLLERLVEAEASDEPYEGKLAVATVVLNRLKGKDWPNTIEGVIYQKGQFSPVANGSIKRPASEDSKKAVREVFDNGYRTFGPEVVFFCNPKLSTDKWMINNRERVTIIGGHHFFK